MKAKAIYVSVWDDNYTIETNCEFDTTTNVVSNIEISDEVQDLDNLIEEYIILQDETIIKSFTNYDTGDVYINGQLED